MDVQNNNKVAHVYLLWAQQCNHVHHLGHPLSAFCLGGCFDAKLILILLTLGFFLRTFNNCSSSKLEDRMSFPCPTFSCPTLASRVKICQLFSEKQHQKLYSSCRIIVAPLPSRGVQKPGRRSPVWMYRVVSMNWRSSCIPFDKPGRKSNLPVLTSPNTSC